MVESASLTANEVTQDCEYCGNSFPINLISCPHCARPSLFPNVTKAQTHVETTKLDDRFQDVVLEGKRRECYAAISQFSDACRNSSAVFRCEIERLHREICTGTDLYETYYDLHRLRLKTSAPKEYDWEKLRPQAEIELLGSHRNIDQIHYACLSLDGQGLGSYGDCAVELAEPMIAHRASCFEGNTALIYADKHDFSDSLRSGWTSRHKLCVAVFGNDIDTATNASDYSGILVVNGSLAHDDRFIEVHVFGAMTAETFASVKIFDLNHTRQQKSLSIVVREKLALSGVATEIA